MISILPTPRYNDIRFYKSLELNWMGGMLSPIEKRDDVKGEHCLTHQPKVPKVLVVG